MLENLEINRSVHWFFVCYHCKLWYFSKKRIKQKKCVRCNKSFSFNNALKFKRNCTDQEAILIVKILKEKEMK